MLTNTAHILHLNTANGLVKTWFVYFGNRRLLGYCKLSIRAFFVFFLSHVIFITGAKFGSDLFGAQHKHKVNHG